MKHVHHYALRWLAVAATVAIGWTSNSVMATTCPSAISSYDSNAGNTAQQDLIRASHPECFGSSSNTAAAAASVKATSIGTMQVVSSALAARFSGGSAPPGKTADAGGGAGLAGGNKGGGWNAWANVSQTAQKYDRGTFFLNGADRTNKFDTNVQNIVVGGDYQLTPDIALGASAAFDDGSGTTTSHTIAAPTGSKSIKTSGYSFAPYLGWQISKELAADFSIGWGNGKSTVDSSIKTDSNRFFYGGNLGYTTWSGNWQLTGKGSYLFGEEKSADSKNNGVTLARTAVTSSVGQFRVAGQAAYWMDGVMPYVGLSYSSDSRSSNASADQKTATDVGNTAWLWSAGINFISLRSGITGGLTYETETNRSRSKSDRWMANVNFRF
jgi:hypothetical protein